MYITCTVCRGRGYNNYSTGPDAVCTVCGGDGRIFILDSKSKPARKAPVWVRFFKWLKSK